jgi:hypothetical protein
MNGLEPDMDETPQTLAVRNYRRRLQRRGMARFEVLGREADRALVRAFARRLAADDAASHRLRAAVGGALGAGAAHAGGIFAALRRSPLVGAELDLTRDRGRGRRVVL